MERIKQEQVKKAKEKDGKPWEQSHLAKVLNTKSMSELMPVERRTEILIESTPLANNECDMSKSATSDSDDVIDMAASLSHINTAKIKQQLD